MELVTDVVNNQLYLYLPVALVLVGAILVFTFGFKSAEQPPFDKLSSISEDKRPASKKRKSKDKKVTVNGSAVAVSDNKTTKEKQSPNKEAPTTPKQTKNKDVDKRKVEVQKLNKPNTLADQTNKKTNKTKASEKPVDFDDGNWETVPTKNDKKTKKQDSPAKKPKKFKKADNENVTNDDGNQKDDNKENIKKIVEEIIKKDVVKEEIPVVQEKKVKKEKNIKPEKVVIQPLEVEDEIVKSAVEEQAKETLKNENVEKGNPVADESSAKGGVAFDELGDVWADAKAVKKSKKKSRRDN